MTLKDLCRGTTPEQRRARQRVLDIGMVSRIFGVSGPTARALLSRAPKLQERHEAALRQDLARMEEIESNLLARRRARAHARKRSRAAVV